MSIPISEADGYLKRLLVEEEDSENEAAFPQPVRYRALQESAIAIARLRPDRFSERIAIPYSIDSDSYKLPDQYDYLLEVIGLSISGQIHSLFGSTDADQTKDDQCWRSNQNTPKTPTNYVWSPQAPRYVYVNGYNPQSELIVIASDLSSLKVDGNTTTIGIPYSYFPELIDYALSRMYSLEDTGAGDSSFHLNRFTQLMNNRLSTDQARNPLVMSMMRSDRR